MNFIAPTAEERRARHAAMRQRDYDNLTKLIEAAELLRAGLGVDGYDSDSEEALQLLEAMYALEPFDDIWTQIQRLTREAA